VGEGDGFIIVSGSDRTSKILGYSDSGSINAADIPSNMRSFLQSYEEQIEAIEQADAKLFAVDDDASADSTESDTLASIEPLLKSNWNQNYPFCAKCPVIKGEQTVTGCGPTAVAQILNYYKYPSSTLALIPGYTYDTLDSLEIDSIAAGMAINWDAISDTYPYCASTTAKDLGLSEEQTDAISSLMMICCTALQASFSANGTGSNFYAIKNTLKNYFGYDDGTSTVDKDLYGEKEWIALLHKELAENRPVIYEGSDKNGNGGHIFILDGYESGETFHINWGWGGYADGYFLLSLCNPLKYEFSIDNAAVIGIMPDDGMKFKEDSIRLTTKRLVANYLENGYNFGSTKSDSIFTRNSPNQNFSMIILFKFKNDMRLTYDFDYGLAINTNDSVAFSSSINVAEGWNSSVLFTFYFGAGLEDGVYTIYPISKESGTDEWLKCRDADKYSLNVMLKGDTLRIYPDRESAEEAFATGISHITYDNNLCRIPNLRPFGPAAFHKTRKGLVHPRQQENFEIIEIVLSNSK